jgi:diguanylate cyclase (GGDEF)-like protein/PAS domain S-box-containing protein
MDTVLLSLGGFAFTVPALAYLVTGLVALGLGLRVLVREQRAEESLYFLFFCIVLFIWLLSFGFMYAAPDAATARDWMHTGYMAIPFVPATIYRFTVQILGSNPRRRIVMGGIWVASALTVVLFVGASYFTEGMARHGWGWIEILNPRGLLVVAFLAAAVGAALLEYVLELREEESPPRRRQLRLLMLAFLLGGLSLVNFLPSFGVSVPPLAYVPVLAGLLVLAHVVQRYRLQELTPSFTADTILRTMNDPVVVVERDGSIRFASEAVRETLGWPPEALRGRSWQTFGERPAREALEGLMASPEPSDAEVSLTTRDGDSLPAAVFASPVTGPWGETLGTVLVIKDLRVHEAARRAVEKAEEKYARLFELNPLAIGVATLESAEFLEVNESFERFFGVPREEAIGSSSVDLGLWVDPADRDRVVRGVRAGRAVDGLEVQMRGAGGDVRDVLFFADAIELEGARALLAMAYDLTERKASERELERRALYDSLTDLPNRSLLNDRLAHALERARRRQNGVAVLFVDLDRFKIVNDSMGHPAGDEVLRQTAGRLQGVVRQEDTVARMGGDEFAIVVEDVGGPADTEAAAARIADAMAPPFRVDGEEVHLSASTGIAFSSSGEETAEELLRRSDVAMYRAKELGGTRHHLFDPATDRRASERLQEENEFRRAIEEGELVLHYQPVVGLDDGRWIGAEALVRWNRPEVGLVPPGEFIPLAEDTGLIVPMGKWVLERAIRDATRWEQQLLKEDEPFTVSVNLSARQYHGGDIEDTVMDALAAAGLAPRRLQLEITESVLLDNPERLVTLRPAGVRIAIDDFGTGYSSLRYLRELSADVVKIDRSFVSGLPADEDLSVLVRAILMIAGQLGMEVVAEGVETEGERRRLLDLGCRRGQGYLFARPMPAGEFEERLAGREPVTG